MSQALDDLIAGLRTMAKRNDVIRDTHGNLSVLDRSCGELYIKPSGVPYEEIEGHMVPCFHAIGGAEVNSTGYRPSVDLPHHMEIYRSCDWVNAICHTHSPYAVAFAIGTRAIPCCSTEQSDYFGGPIRCIPYHDLDTWGAHAVPAAKEKALLLGNHGALTFGRTAKEAVNLAIALENVAQKTYLALMLHDPSAFQIRLPCPPTLAEEEVRKWHERYTNVYGQK